MYNAWLENFVLAAREQQSGIIQDSFIAHFLYVDGQG